MAQNFSQARNVELSLLYYLETNLNADWTGIAVLKSSNDVYTTTVNLPVVVAQLIDTQSVYKEVGATTLEDRYLAMIDIFAKSDGQRIDLAYYIKNKLKDGWVHYDHSRPSGNTAGDLTRVADGRDFVTEYPTDSRVDFGEQVDQKDKYRHSLAIRIRKST